MQEITNMIRYFKVINKTKAKFSWNLQPISGGGLKVVEPLRLVCVGGL